MQSSDSIVNAFTAAAFLANEAWLMSNAIKRTRWVHYDNGASTVIPSISLSGVIVVSVLLFIFLNFLLATALHSALAYRWTDQLDAFAMMKIGAEVAQHVPLKVSGEPSGIRVLNEQPGWIGARKEKDDTDAVSLGLGAPKALHGRRTKYASYKGVDI